MFVMGKHLQFNMNDYSNLKGKDYHKAPCRKCNQGEMPKAGPSPGTAGGTDPLMENWGACSANQLVLEAER